jgi:hypothetical protein
MGALECVLEQAVGAFDDNPMTARRWMTTSDPAARWIGPARQRSLLLHAAFHEILSLRADDLLIDRLLEAVEPCLCHAQLHRVLTFLP